jgi:CubicO group peptidase (beta-lactamase class C family)
MRYLLIAAAAVLLALGLLWAKPPELTRVMANYAAKIVCSNTFVANRDPQEVLQNDVQAPGNPLLRLIRISVDRDQRTVRAGLLGFIGDGLAVARPGVGCAAVPDGDLARARAAAAADPAPVDAAPLASASIAPPPNPPSPAAPGPQPAAPLWPEGSAVLTDPAVERVLADEALAGPGMRAVVVVHSGRIVAERYGAGFSAATPLLGWSMAKTVVAALIGIQVKDGRLTLDGSAGFPAAAHDGRERIRIADLLAMTSGLRFNEAYGNVSDVTRMLYLEPDMAAFARRAPLEHPVGEVWSYSSGSTLILSRLFQDSAGPHAVAFVRERLFEPLGITSATFETDESGTLVGSAYLYADARDWARFGLLLLQEGVWQGREILPPGYVAMMTAPVAPSGGQYAHGQLWRWGPDAVVAGQNPDTAFNIPADAFWLEGHDGQSIAIIPSRALVLVRLGLTPASTHYGPQPLVQAVLGAL